MDIRSLIDGVVKLANMASVVIPGAGLVAKGAEIGGKILASSTICTPTQTPLSRRKCRPRAKPCPTQ